MGEIKWRDLIIAMEQVNCSTFLRNNFTNIFKAARNRVEGYDLIQKS